MILEVNSSLGVVIPAFNEEEGIAPTIKELKLAINDARIIVIDGNSQDKTPEIAKDLGARLSKDALAAKEAGVAAVNFGGGECALRKDFIELCKYLKKLVFLDPASKLPASNQPVAEIVDPLEEAHRRRAALRRRDDESAHSG